MDNKTAYKEQMYMENSNPPPAYNYNQPLNASAPAAQPEFNIQANITDDNAPRLMPIMNMPFTQPVGQQSVEMTCPNCRCRIKTKVTHRSTTKTHLACLLLTWTICCCCVPYCMDSCRNANHFCPMCGTFIGTYKS